MTTIGDFRAHACEVVRHGWERNIPGRVASADFAWARAQDPTLLQAPWTEFARSEREAMTSLGENNIGRVAIKLTGSISVVDFDAPSQHLGDLAAGEYGVRRSGRVGAMPSLGEQFNDWHQREGLRAAAMHLREARRR